MASTSSRAVPISQPNPHQLWLFQDCFKTQPELLFQHANNSIVILQYCMDVWSSLQSANETLVKAFKDDSKCQFKMDTLSNIAGI